MSATSIQEDNSARTPERFEIGTHVANIVAAYVANHTIEASALPGLIQAIHHTVWALSDPNSKVASAAPVLQPAVPIKKSVFADYIVCLEDGKKLKLLKRHLKAAYNMEPDDYRAKWGLPDNYPMIAPNYAEIRSGLAKKSGLGTKAPPRVEFGNRQSAPGRRQPKRQKTQNSDSLE